MFDVSLEGLDRFEAEWKRGVDDLTTDVARAAHHAAKEGVKAEQDRHPYTDRTYQLTDTARATLPESVGDGVESDMVWSKEYASFVTKVSGGRYDFTPVAIDAATSELDRATEEAAQRFADKMSGR